MEEVEDQDRQDRNGSRDHISHSVSSSSHHDLGIDLFPERKIEPAHPEFYSDGKDQDRNGRCMESQFLRMKDLCKRILEKTKAAIQNQEGNDESSDILDPPVTKRMILVSRFLRHLDADQTDNRRTGIREVVEGICRDGYAVEQAS